MSKSKTDIIFIVLIGLLLTNTLIQSYIYHYVLSLNNYLGIAGWVVVLILLLVNHHRKRLALVLLIISGTFDVLSSSVETSTIGFAIGSVKTNMIGFNPIAFLVLVTYYLVNHKRINQIIMAGLYGNSFEREKEHKKKVKFYLNKFRELDRQELAKVINDMDQYPLEAQTAIRIIISSPQSVIDE